MANATLTINSKATGVYDNSPMAVQATEAITVILVEDVVMTISAAKTRWADALPNKYTVTITNTGTMDFDLQDDDTIHFETDAFNPTLVTIDQSSVAVTGNTPTNIVVSAGGVLSMDLTEAIVKDTPTIITFDINKIP
jgi:hypothetical protein